MDNETIYLNLENNNITEIPSGSFKNMPSLRRLNLLDNPLRGISKDSFRGLHLLEHLEIGSFNKPTDRLVPLDLLTDLTNITTLHLNYFYPNELQPGVLMNMTNLETLIMPMNDKAMLGHELENMLNLSFLHITRVRKYFHLTDDTLATVPGIDKLMVTPWLTSMSPYALKHFTKLSSLSLLFSSHFPIKQVFDAIKNMKGPMLTELVLDGTHDRTFYELTPELLNSENFANIKLISLKNTNLLRIDPKCLLQLSNLNYVSLGFNSILSEKFDKTSVLQLLDLVHIKALEISSLYQRMTSAYFRHIYFTHSLDTFPTPPKLITIPSNLTAFRANDYTRELIGDGAYKFLPLSLLYVYARNLPQFAIQMLKHQYTAPENNILYVDLSHTKLNGNLPILRGFDKLQGINLESCDIQSVHKDQLRYFPQLKYLNLKHNNLYQMDITTLFPSRSRLQWLDLSYNKFQNLSTLLISNLSSLEHASFKGNPLVTVTLDLLKNKNLKMLDLSDCSLVNLADNFMHQLDDFQSKFGRRVSLNLSNNRFDCSCTTLNMINWFQHTNVPINDRELINCTYKNVKTPIVSVNYNEIFKECATANRSLLASIITPLGVFCLFSVMFTMAYQFKWQLRWYIYKFRRYIRHFSRKTNYDILLEVKYNAFVSHNHDNDYEWVTNDLLDLVEEQWHLKLCIGQRDFEPGKPISENIIDAIDSSHKTILVITPAFVQSKWCEFELQIALVKGRDCIIIIYKQEVPVEDMSKTLRALMKSVNYIEYSEDAAGLRMFRHKLQSSLQDNVNA